MSPDTIQVTPDGKAGAVSKDTHTLAVVGTGKIVLPVKPTKAALAIQSFAPALAQDPASAAIAYLAEAKDHTVKALFLQVLTGVALLELKSQLGVAEGARTDLMKHDERLAKGYKHFVEETLGVSFQTANLWTNLASAAVPRLKKLATLDDPEAMRRAVLKLCDGQTQGSLAQELGLVKKPAKGSGVGGPKEKGATTKLDAEKPDPGWDLDMWRDYATAMNGGDSAMATAIEIFQPWCHLLDVEILPKEKRPFAHLPPSVLEPLHARLAVFMEELGTVVKAGQSAAAKASKKGK